MGTRPSLGDNLLELGAVEGAASFCLASIFSNHHLGFRDRILPKIPNLGENKDILILSVVGDPYKKRHLHLRFLLGQISTGGRIRFHSGDKTGKRQSGKRTRRFPRTFP